MQVGECKRIRGAAVARFWRGGTLHSLAGLVDRKCIRQKRIFLLMAKKWYLLHTNHGKEKIVVGQLEGFDVDLFCPMVTIERGHRRGTREEALFPHYLFVHADILADNLPSLAYLPGVRTLVHFGGRPAIVPDAIIAQLQDGWPDANRSVPWPITCFKPGQPLRVRSGPFAGLDAIFQQGLKGTERAQVLIDLLGSLSRVELDVHCLESA